MPSGKTARKRRSTKVRVPSPPVRADSRRASPKVLLIVGGAIVAVAIGIVLVVTLGGGGSSSNADVPAVGSLQGALPGAAEVQRMFKGIPQSTNTLGPRSAPVTMVEYVDLQCPYCAAFETSALPKLLSKYVRPGQLRVEQRLLAFIGPDSQRGRSAGLAAGLQNKQFNFTELLYVNQGTENTGWLDENMVVATASSIPGLRVPEMLDAQSSSAVKDEESTLDAEAEAAGIHATPTILVGKTGGKLSPVALSSPADEASVAAAIDGVLGG
jgi:protein-disulfide isomerase